MWDALKRDAVRYEVLGKWYTCAGFWLVAVYRFGVWANQLPPLLRFPMWLLYRVTHPIYLVYNLHLWAGRRGARIGPGLFLVHPNNIYVGPGVEIGSNCTLHHEVTLGMGHVPGTPRISDRVSIFPGARVLGGVRIGENALVGANCVVVRDVPADMVVMPPPSRLLPRSLSAHGRVREAADGAPAGEAVVMAAAADDPDGNRGEA